MGGFSYSSVGFVAGGLHQPALVSRDLDRLPLRLLAFAFILKYRSIRNISKLSKSAHSDSGELPKKSDSKNFFLKQSPPEYRIWSSQTLSILFHNKDFGKYRDPLELVFCGFKAEKVTY